MNYKFKNSAAGPELVLTPADGHEITLLTDMLFDQRRGKLKSANMEIVPVMEGNQVISLSIREKAYVSIEVVRGLFQSVRAYSWGVLGIIPGAKTIIILGNGTFKGYVVNEAVAFPDLENSNIEFDKNTETLFIQGNPELFSLQVTNAVLINTIDELTKFINNNK